jgi:DNA-binding NarL/FixJ family response regulator
VLDDVRKLHAAAPLVPIAVLNSRAAAKEIAAAIEAGASSWISARAPTAEIAAAIKTVGSGLVVLSRSSARAFLDAGRQNEPRQLPPPRIPARDGAIALPAGRRARTIPDRERSVRAILTKLSDETAPTSADIRNQIA